MYGHAANLFPPVLRSRLHPPRHRCPRCKCNVTPRHVTGSEECEDLRVERLISIAD